MDEMMLDRWMSYETDYWMHQTYENGIPVQDDYDENYEW